MELTWSEFNSFENYNVLKCSSSQGFLTVMREMLVFNLP